MNFPNYVLMQNQTYGIYNKISPVSLMRHLHNESFRAYLKRQCSLCSAHAHVPSYPRSYIKLCWTNGCHIWLAWISCHSDFASVKFIPACGGYCTHSREGFKKRCKVSNSKSVSNPGEYAWELPWSCPSPIQPPRCLFSSALAVAILPYPGLG